MSDGISEANRETDYTIDPIFGTCNACGCVGCSFGCMKEQRDALRRDVTDIAAHPTHSSCACITALKYLVRSFR